MDNTNSTASHYYRGHPQYYFNKLMLKEQSHPPAAKTIVATPDVVMQAPGFHITKNNVERDILTRLTPHLLFSDLFVDSSYLQDLSRSAYRTALGNTNFLENCVREQFKKPLRLVAHFEQQQYHPRQFIVAWQLINALMQKQTVRIEHALLVHRLDVPRDLVLHNNPDYRRFSLVMQRYIDNIPTKVHRLFLVVSLPQVNNALAVQVLMYLDFVEDDDRLFLEGARVLPLNIPVVREQADLLSANVFHSKATAIPASWLDEPKAVYAAWRRHSKGFLRLRSAKMRALDTLLAMYSNSISHSVSKKFDFEMALDELQTLLLIKRACQQWLDSFENVSSCTAAMLDLRQWIFARFRKVARCFMQEVYQVDFAGAAKQYEMAKAFAFMQQF